MTLSLAGELAGAGIAAFLWLSCPPMTGAQDVDPSSDPESVPETGGDEGPIIPQAHPEERYLDIWLKSPFMLEAAPEPMQAQKSFARDFFLVGYIESKSETVVYLKNQKTGESVRVPPYATKGDAPEFKLVELKKASDPRQVRATISLAGETAEIGRDPSAFSQAASPGLVAQGDAQDQPAIPGQPNRPPAQGLQRPIGNSPLSANGAPVKLPPGGGVQPSQNPDGSAPYVNPAAERLRQQQAAAAAKAAGLPEGTTALPANPAGRRRIILPTPAQ